MATKIVATIALIILIQNLNFPIGKVEGASISNGVRHAIIPSIPDPLDLDPFTVHITYSNWIYGAFFMRLGETRLTGLSSSIHEFSYNCFTQKFEVAFLFPPGVTAMGPYNLDGEFMTSFVQPEPTFVNVTGQISLDAPQCENPNDCLFLARGRVIQFGGELIIEDFQLTRSNYIYAMTLTVENGTVDGQPLEGDALNMATYITNDFGPMGATEIVSRRLRFYLQDRIQNMTLNELIEASGGQCGQEETKAAIIPPQPDILEFENGTYTNIDSLYDDYLNHTLAFYGMAALKSELSYNCLSSNYELALFLPALNGQGVFNIDGKKANGFPDAPRFNATGIVREFCPEGFTVPDGCLLWTYGQLQKTEDGTGVMFVDYDFDHEIEIEFVIEEWAVGEDPEGWEWIIYAHLDYFKRLMTDHMRAELKSYMNSVLMNYSMAQIIEMTGGNCSA